MNHLAAKIFLASIVALLIAVSVGHAQSTAFSYQGKLTDGGNPASGTYDLSFKLYETLSGGTQIGTEQIADDVNVSGGLFTVTLNFGSSPFTSSTGNFLEIAVRPGASTDPFTVLDPRQPITSSPYAVQTLRAASAATADDADALGGVPASEYVQTNDSRLSDARTPLPGSANYVHNSTVQQPLSNFNISGNGTANLFNAATQFNIGGNRVLSLAGTNNFFAGVGAGENNTGPDNSFVGRNAGQANTSGQQSTFFGSIAGQSNTTGSFNAFFGTGAGSANLDGAENSFFGYTAGRSNTTASINSFFGKAAGFSNTTGRANAFVGYNAGFANTTGSNNTFLGVIAGDSNTIGSKNTLVGSGADVSTNNLNFATAIGADAVVTSSNTVVLGRNADTVQVPGNLSVAGTVTGAIATANNALNLGGVAANQFVHTSDSRLTDARAPTPGSANYIQNGTGVQSSSNFNISGTGTGSIFNATTQFNLNGNRVLGVAGTGNVFAGIAAGQFNTGQSNTFVGASAGTSNSGGSGNSFFGDIAGLSNTSGSSNSFFGLSSGFSNTTGSQNSSFGIQAGTSNTTGSKNTFVGALSNTSAGNLTNATAIGADAVVSQSNSLVLGNNANVGIGTGSPDHRLHVVGTALITGFVRAPGGIFIANPNTLFITSPNGACWGITVNNAGALSTFSTACP